MVDGNHVSFNTEVRLVAAKESETIIHAKRLAREFSRSFVLPSEVDDDYAETKLEDSILRLILPKKPAVRPKAIAVQ